MNVKTATGATVVALLALTGCSATTSAEDAAVNAKCAELEATVIEGDTATAQAARDAIERSIEALCD